MPTELQKKRDKLKEVNGLVGKAFKQAGTEKDMSKVDCLGNELKTTVEKVERINRLNDESKELLEEIKPLLANESAEQDQKAMEEYLKTPARVIIHPQGTAMRAGTDGIMAPHGVPFKALSQEFIESKAYTDRAQHVSSEFRVDQEMNLKTLFETTSGFAPESVRTGLVVPIATTPIDILDIINTRPINSAQEVYMEQTTRTNTAAETAENAAYKQATIVYTERTETIRKVTISLPVTDEQLADETRVSSLINDDLRLMLNQRLNTQMLTGDGVTPNMTGYNNKSGILSQAKGTDNVINAVYKGADKVRITGQAVPTHYVTHPTDFQDIRLETTSDGIYIWGHPSQTGPMTIFGMLVVLSQAQTLGTGLVGDFANPTYSQLLMRQGIVLKTTDSHNDDFTDGRIMIRAELRAALVIRRAAAFCEITNI